MIGVDQICATIPHRPPILMLDGVSEIEPGRRLTGHRTVTGTELRLGDDRPMLSASLLVESWAQAALVLLLWQQPNPDVRTGQVAVIGTVEGLRFGRSVRPGEEIEHRVTLARRYGHLAVVRGSALVGGATVLEVDRMVAALRPATELEPGRSD